ncbi:hypothetical protein [Pontibacter sp. G13]|uniref:hypothetical protein n=1 Tax=Pontibacter sp. G13 TaxID=3074898 RepID=UPI002889A289|nr:hypothetical protein [Pontibacter sp. G13]WNJ20083.1 hypothetical protein RJD25_06325 [Pontibacter sp. G13]
MTHFLQQYRAEWAIRFQEYSSENLVQVFNREVEVNGWTGTRGAFLAALTMEFDRRNWDYSAIGSQRFMSMRRKVKLVGQSLIPLD